MNNDGFETFEGSTGFRAAERPHSIHIHIEDNETRPSLSTQNIPSIIEQPNNASSSLHSMLNRVRNNISNNTIRNNIGQSSTEWRMNLNNLRTLISSSGIRYTPLSSASSSQLNEPFHGLNDTEEHIHGRIDRPNDSEPSESRMDNFRRARESLRSNRSPFHENLFAHNHNNASSDLRNVANNTTQHTPIETRQPSRTNGPQNQADTTASNEVPHAHLDEENNNNNVFSDIVVRVLGNFVRYLPFLAILFVKFIHDHLLGILDIVLLQSVLYVVNKSLCHQISKLSDKSCCVLMRDFGLVAAAAIFRFLLSASSPDLLLGLTITPPAEIMTIKISTATQSGQSLNGGESSGLNMLKKFLSSLNQFESLELDDGITLTTLKGISIGLLIYYIAVNDLFLKMLTVLTKIFVTLLPNTMLRHKQRAQMYALIEYFSQFYRALVPTRQWIMFLFKSYTGLEVISGILFSAFYMGAKGFEFASRGKVLHNAFKTFIRNMDYERKPTKDEMDAAGLICPICHDTFSSPIILTCNHVFCDDCVSQWFKREQTCPMCRAKVSDDPQWQDGSTTFFYQLC